MEPNLADSKRCPYCAELIHIDALKCKHCGEWLQPSSPPPPVPSEPNRERLPRVKSFGLSWIVPLLYVCLSLYLGALAFFLVSSWLQYGLLAKVEAQDSTVMESIATLAQANDLRQSAASWTSVGAYAICWFLSMLFVSRAQRNVRRLGATGLRFSPRFAAGCFYVPIVGIFLYYSALSELWRASQWPLEWKTAKPSWLLRIWWALFVLNTAFGWLLSHTGRGLEDIGALISVTVALIIFGSLEFLRTLLYLLLIRSILGGQRRNESTCAAVQSPAAPGEVPA